MIKTITTLLMLFTQILISCNGISKPEKNVSSKSLLTATTDLKKDSIVLSQQIRTLDKIRLIRKIGEINDFDTKQKVIEALNFQLLK